MNELVMIKRNNVFTNSLIIAEGTNNEHRVVRRLIEKYENDLKDFGKVCILNAHLETKGKTLNGVCLEIFWNYFKKNQNSKDRIH